MHPDIGLDCDGYHAYWKGTNYWRGIMFQDAEYEEQLFQENTLYQKVRWGGGGVLEFVDHLFIHFFLLWLVLALLEVQ